MAYQIIDNGQYDKDGNFDELVMISGGCPNGGVDIWAEEVADKLGIKKIIFKPEVNQWEDKIFRFTDFSKELSEPMIKEGKYLGYRSRNIKIAEACDVLYCVVPKIVAGYCKHCKTWGHNSNGGCWTMSWARRLGKKIHLVVIE